MATENYTLGRGEVWFEKDGTHGFRFLGNVPTFNVNVQSDKLEHFRSTRGTKEKDKTITLQTNRTATIEAEDISVDNLALFFLGSAAVISQASATGQTETFAAVVPGMMYQVGVTTLNPSGTRSLTTPVLKKGATVLVVGTDYTIDASRGSLTIIQGGAVVAGDSVTLEFGRAAVSRKQVISGSDAASGKLRFVAYPAEGDPVDYLMPSVEISPNGDYSLISANDLQKLPLTVDIQTAGALAAIYADGAPYAP